MRAHRKKTHGLVSRYRSKYFQSIQETPMKTGQRPIPLPGVFGRYHPWLPYLTKFHCELRFSVSLTARWRSWLSRCVIAEHFATLVCVAIENAACILAAAVNRAI
ncbi:hypothetical protein TRVL_09824 [Trypanosoma vivax]|nr:hypothetical protein TRVL_09824 [Trypanosoma vivax]